MLTPDPLAADSAPKSETITSTLLYAIQPVQPSCPKEGASHILLYCRWCGLVPGLAWLIQR